MNCNKNCCDEHTCNYDEPMVSLSFSYTDEYGTTTTLNKRVPLDYLDEDCELCVVNRVYQEFLTACTFAVNSDDVVVVLPQSEAYELGL